MFKILGVLLYTVSVPLLLLGIWIVNSDPTLNPGYNTGDGPTQLLGAGVGMLAVFLFGAAGKLWNK